MQWLTGTPNFNFVKYRRVAMATSSLLSLLAIISVFYPGLNYGLDFTGGVIVEAGYTRPVELDPIRDGLTAAGFEWREPGCSMCLAMNPDTLSPGERCASTSNRNFEGRQGRGGRTHLVSPAVAAATAVAGHFATPEDLA